MAGQDSLGCVIALLCSKPGIARVLMQSAVAFPQLSE